MKLHMVSPNYVQTAPNRVPKSTVIVVGPFRSKDALFAWLNDQRLWPHRIYRIGREWSALVRVEEA